MCGNQRRAARYNGACGSRNQREAATGSIASIIGAIQEIKLASHGIDSKAPTGYSTMPTVHIAEQDSHIRGIERGVTHDYPYAADEKKRLQKETVAFEELPSYEASTGVRSGSSASSTVGEPIYTPATSEASYTPDRRDYHQAQPHNQLPSRVDDSPLLHQLEVFRTSLLSYTQGAPGARKDAKHAARSMVRDLRAQEMERSRGESGCLKSSERKQVRRELKLVKDVLRDAVWEAKQERKGRH